MPDWITHIAVAWILCTIIGFKYRQFNSSTTAIAMIGSVIPDIIKVGIISETLGLRLWDFLSPIHLPIGSLVITAMVSLFFQEKKTIFLFLTIGLLTHYGLDLLLKNVNGGIYLLFPLYWGQWQLGLITSEDYTLTIISIIGVYLVYLISRFLIKNNNKVQ